MSETTEMHPCEVCGKPFERLQSHLQAEIDRLRAENDELIEAGKSLGYALAKARAGDGNAPLIAAASEMLVALKEALRALDGDPAINSRGMVAYAISKAEGKSKA